LEIVVASGKGGTGKTFIASNLTLFLKERMGNVVSLDADIEAPDLLTALGGPKNILKQHEIWDSAKAEIDYSKCVHCMRCLKVCSFHALREKSGRIEIIPEFCEGCGACKYVCPTNAITYKKTRTGVIYIAQCRLGVPVVTGDLEVGQRNLGHLVYEAKKVAKKVAEEVNSKHIIVDAAAGIGCPVISSLAGADVLLIVVEPTPQSLKGAKRLLQVAEKFNLEKFMIINKYDLNREFSRKINDYFKTRILGRIPYNEDVIESYTAMNPILVYKPGSPISKTLKEIFQTLVEEAEI